MSKLLLNVCRASYHDSNLVNRSSRTIAGEPSFFGFDIVVHRVKMGNAEDGYAVIACIRWAAQPTNAHSEWQDKSVKSR